MLQQTIQSLTFFHSLKTEQIDLLASLSYCKKHPKDYILHYENSTSNTLLFLIKGLAKSYKIDKHDNEIFLYHTYPGSLLSEISSLSSDTLLSYANIAIEEEAEILYIDYARFKRHFLDTALLSRQIGSEIIRQSKQLQEIINREFVLDSVSKVAMMLDKDLSMFNRLKRYDVSLMLHIQPATLSRVLNRLKRDEIITIDHGEIIIRDDERLKHIYKEQL